MMASIGQLGEFNPERDDWTIYEERMEQYFVVNKIGDALKVATLLSVIGTAVYQTLRDLTSPTLPKDKTYNELTVLLKRQYAPHISIMRERIKFYELRQMDRETVNEWNVRIRRAAINCKFGPNLDEILKDKFVSGLQKGKVQDRLCEEDETKAYSEFLTLAQKVESSVVNQQSELNFVKRNQVQHRPLNRPIAARFPRNDGNATAPTRRYGQTYGQMSGNIKSICYHCGKNHGNAICRYKSYVCRKCNRVGHLENVCKSIRRQNFVDECSENNDLHSDVDCDDEENFEIYSLTNEKNHNPFKMNVTINNKNFECAVDTGAAITALNYKFYVKNFSDFDLHDDSIILKGYTGHVINTVGYFYAPTTVRNTTKSIKYHVVDNDGPNLIGRNFLKNFDIRLDLNNVFSVESFESQIINKFPEVFTDKLGEYKYLKVSIPVKPDTKPIFQKPRPVPLAYRKQIEDQLRKMVDDKVIEPVEASNWGTQIVVVHKTDGTLRICGNYKRTVNPNLENIRYPLPRIEEIFDKLRGGVFFSKMDLNGAYNQLALDEASQEMLSLSTHIGIFKQLRMPYGITPASAIFQRIIDQLTQGIPFTASYQDDIIVSGKSLENCRENLEVVLEKLKAAGLTIKRKKCELFKKEIEYLGHVITRDGLKKSESKIEAIKEAPRPSSIHAVRSFCGLVQYYSKFIPNLSQILSPIYQLLTKGTKFEWNEKCEHSFQLIKKLIAQDIILTRFDPEKPVILITDASSEGISAILYHKEANGTEKPIACCSRTLMPQEKVYATIDQEALAIVYGCKRFSNYLQGISFTIRTDHMPLLGLFKENKEIPQRHRDRLQRWALYLSGFNYKLEHIKGTQNHFADCLSRIPMPTKTTSEEYDYEGMLNYAEKNEEWPLDNNKVKEETRNDKELQELKKFMEEGWPKNCPEEIKPYFIRKEELSIENDCILWGYRVIIPKTLREEVLNQLHNQAGHLGISKTKSIARSYAWWPKMDLEIENEIKACIPCLKSLPDPPKAAATPWPIAQAPFERVHIDFFQLKNLQFLIVVDAHSKWLEAFEMKTTKSYEVEEKLRSFFTNFGIPRTVVSDNGPNLVSKDLQRFFNKNGIKRLTSPPFSPKSNGQAEICVKTVKTKLKAALESSNERISVLLARFLLNYRNSVHSTTGKSPAELVFGRKLRTKLDLLREIPLKATVSQEQAIENMEKKNEKLMERGMKKDLNVGEEVMVRDYRRVNHKGWIEAKVENQLGKSIYDCKLQDGGTWKRHKDQIRKRLERNEGYDRYFNKEPIEAPFRIAYTEPPMNVMNTTINKQNQSDKNKNSLANKDNDIIVTSVNETNKDNDIVTSVNETNESDSNVKDVRQGNDKIQIEIECVYDKPNKSCINDIDKNTAKATSKNVKSSENRDNSKSAKTSNKIRPTRITKKPSMFKDYQLDID